MKCPACSNELKMADRQGVEIDYCPSCRGVWLDRGELDKIIERSAATYDDRNRRDERRELYDNRERYDNLDDSDEGRRYGYKGHKRKSFLGDLFDF